MNNLENRQFLRIGILQCDEVRPQFRQQYGDYDDMLINGLCRANAHFSYKVFRVFEGHLPNDIDDCDAWITSGSKHSVNDDCEWTHALSRFVRQLAVRSKPYVGICYGMQMIAKALGGVVQLSGAGWGVGVAANDVATAEPWMCPAADVVRLLISHKEQVTVLPKGARRLAGNTLCPNGIIMWNRSMLGIQGHPEFHRDYAKSLMDFRRDIIAPRRLAEGLSSLADEPDNEQVFDWIAGFFFWAIKRKCTVLS
ncbi:MAG: GMP synthase [Pseudomonadota bacterium]|nr:GMP synthase [Pseudomonadota bacterium]